MDSLLNALIFVDLITVNFESSVKPTSMLLRYRLVHCTCRHLHFTTFLLKAWYFGFLERNLKYFFWFHFWRIIGRYADPLVSAYYCF